MSRSTRKVRFPLFEVYLSIFERAKSLRLIPADADIKTSGVRIRLQKLGSWVQVVDAEVEYTIDQEVFDENSR